jgi:hypothetical protein
MPTSSTGIREYICVPFITKKFNENTKDTALGKEIVSFLNSFKNITNTTSPSDMADYKEGLFNRLSFLCIEDDLHLNVDKNNNLIFKRKNK